MRADTLERTEVDQDIDQRVEVGDCSAIAQLGTLDPESGSLGIDAFGSCALLVEVFVGLAVAAKLVADARADAVGQRGGAAAFGKVRIVQGTGLAGWFRKEERTDVARLSVRDAGGVRAVLAGGPSEHPGRAGKPGAPGGAKT